MAFAWTPGTHIYLGEAVLANLPLLPTAVAALPRAFPYDFLYGSIAADTSIAKKYAPVGRHCHAWHVGQEIFDRADGERLQAFGLGYLAHLAADTVAHNFFVPRQLVVASTTIAIGHSYWESRFETHLGDQSRAPPWTSSGWTTGNRTRTWAGSSRPRSSPSAPAGACSAAWWASRKPRAGRRRFASWPSGAAGILSDDEVERQMRVAFQLVMEMLTGGVMPQARRLDPAGEASLRMAKQVRLEVLRNRLPRDPWRLSRLAEDRFGLPGYALPFWERSTSPHPWRLRDAARAMGAS